jgi:putative phosphoesterase
MIAIISDIHGNLPALEAVLKDIERFNVDKVISLGDVSGYYPFVDDCIDILRVNGVINLMGNHDFYLASGLGCPRSKSVNQLSELFSDSISQNNMEYLSSSPLFYKCKDVIMTHAGFNNPIDEYLYNISEEYFKKFKYTYFFSGHTHVQHLELFDNGKVYCNPGSVGQPRDGNNEASYALFDPIAKEVVLKRVPYNINLVISRLKNYGFDKYYYENLLDGSRIGGKVDSISVKRN